MLPTVLGPALLVAFALAVAAWALAGAVQPARSRALANLRRGDADLGPQDATGRSAGLAAIARTLTPAPFIALLERQHARAGRPSDWTIDRLLVLKLVWVPLSMVMAVVVSALGAQPLVVIVIAFFALLVYFLPDLLLLSRGQDRDQKIQVELADTLDQMTIAVEAGLAFDAAMVRAAANGKGVLAEELTRTLQDMRMGLSRRAAFADLGARTQVPDLRQFVRAIVQADANGISVGDVLRAQADELRLKRRQRAELKAQQVPVKAVFPLILCILPVLFIVVMTPALLGAMEAFSQM